MSFRCTMIRRANQKKLFQEIKGRIKLDDESLHFFKINIVGNIGQKQLRKIIILYN